MAQSNPNFTDIFTDLANVIREKKGTSAEIYPVDFADEVATITGGGGQQPQIHAPTNVHYSQKTLTWAIDSYAEASKIYLDNALIATITTPTVSYDVTAVIESLAVGSHSLAVTESATYFIESTKTSTTIAKRSISVSVTNGTYSGPTVMMQDETVQIVIEPDAGLIPNILSITNCTWSISTNVIYLSNPSGNVNVVVECVDAGGYIIGISGISRADGVLTRTDQASAASITKTTYKPSIIINNIDISKIWSGYVGDDEQPITVDASKQKAYDESGAEYTGNIFSKINRFFVKPGYIGDALDSLQLCYSDEKPDESWQDWFNGKSCALIGMLPSDIVALESKISGFTGSKKPANILQMQATLRQTDSNCHLMWYNELAIIQALFIVLMGDVRYERVMAPSAACSSPQFCSEIVRAIDYTYTNCGTIFNSGSSEGTSSFLGVTQFLAPHYLIGGVAFDEDNNAYATMDFDAFTLDYRASKSDLQMHAAQTHTYACVKSVRCSETHPGLMLHTEMIYKTFPTNDEDTYFACEGVVNNTNSFMSFGRTPSYYSGYVEPGIMSIRAIAVDTASANYYCRLCRTPKN